MKAVLISISLLIVLSISSFNSSADQIVKGLVRSKTDKRALPGVRVSIKETRISVQTDSNGYYEIKVPEDKDILVFTFFGFLSHEIKISSEKLGPSLYNW